MLTAGGLGNGKASGFFGIGQIPMPTNPVIYEMITTPLGPIPPPLEVAAKVTKRVATGVLDTVADFVEDNKVGVYAGIAILGFLAIWRKK